MLNQTVTRLTSCVLKKSDASKTCRNCFKRLRYPHWRERYDIYKRGKKNKQSASKWKPVKVTLTTMWVLDSTKLSSAFITWSLLLVLLKFVWHSSFGFCARNIQSIIQNIMGSIYSSYVKMNRSLELTLNPSIRKPRVVVELSVSLHCMYLVFSTAFWARSWTVGASGSTATIFSYMSLRGWGRSRASSSSSSR